MVILTKLHQLLQVFVQELLPELLVNVAQGFGVPTQVLNELYHLHVGHLGPVITGRVMLEVVVSLLVAEAPVEVPDGSEDVLAGVVLETFFIAKSTFGMVKLEVADEFVHHKEARQL